MANQCHVVEQLSQATSPWFCVGVSTGGVPCSYGPGLDGNDPLLSLRLYAFILCVVLVLHSGTSALIWGGGVLICSPWYVFSGVCVGSCGTHIVFGCIHYTVHWGFFICCSLLVTVPSVGGWVQIPVCALL